MDEQDWLAERFEEHQTRLRFVAYRMLGSVAEAADAVQEAWLRLSRQETRVIENLGGWLTTVVARVWLNMLHPRKVVPAIAWRQERSCSSAWSRALGSPAKGAAWKLPATLGVLALVLAVPALATGSLTPLSLLVVDIVVLWAVSTVRHASCVPPKSVPT